MIRRRVLILGLLLLAALIAIIAIALSVSSKHSEKSDNQAPSSEKKTHDAKPSDVVGPHWKAKSKEASASDEAEPEEIEPNPLNETYSLTALAIGDWGRTVAKDGGSCCSRRKAYTVMDYNAMEYTASLLGLAAQQMQPRPSVVIGQGDNFYWTGLQSANDAAYRFQETFESKYSDASLSGIPWINVMGNHDYGGASYLCSSGDVPAKCGSTSELISSLNQKFKLQAQYVSPNDNRWIMSDHFYVHKLLDPVSGLEIEIFNMDTNDADTHGARQICCQCYGYANGQDSQCEDVDRGHSYCAGGDTGMYDACMKQLRAWGDDSRAKLVEAVETSNATWKIVNTHYSPYNHYAPYRADAWHELLSDLGIQLFIYGHTHGEKHDYANFKTHFIENGAGGGIQNESPSGIPPYATDYVQNIWAAGHYPYGIFSLKISPNWLQVEFLTFDNKWIMRKELRASVVGGVAVKHCWYIPQSGRKGRSCDSL